MEKLKQSIINNYNEDIKHFIKNELKPNGYIITNNGIYQINAFTNEFEHKDMDNVINLINEHVTNYWSIPYEMQKEIIQNNCFEILPATTTMACDNYLEYVNMAHNMVNDKDLQKEVKELIKENEKRHKKVFQGGYNSPEHQSQVLINNNVFYSNGYWIFDKKQNRFVQIGSNEIMEMLRQNFKQFNATKLDIKDYMTVTWPLLITKTNIPIRYNNQMTNKLKMDEIKKDYTKIDKLIRSYT